MTRISQRKVRRLVGDVRPTAVNTGNMVQKLRRMRVELGLMLNTVDSALERLVEENQYLEQNQGTTAQPQ